MDDPSEAPQGGVLGTPNTSQTGSTEKPSYLPLCGPQVFSIFVRCIILMHENPIPRDPPEQKVTRTLLSYADVAEREMRGLIQTIRRVEKKVDAIMVFNHMDDSEE